MSTNSNNKKQRFIASSVHHSLLIPIVLLSKMALSQSTIIKLADALSTDVAQYITEDERFFDLMVELIPDAIHAKLGDVDDMIIAELSMCISERMRLIGD
jgi:hypothetical protein